MDDQAALLSVLTRIADALDRMAPPAQNAAALADGDAFRWSGGRLHPVPHVQHVSLQQLKGIDRQREILMRNTKKFAAGAPANNALLWGAKGTGKSSIVKAIHAELSAEMPGSLVLIEIPRDEIATMPALLHLLGASERRFLLFCDDLSFEADDATYKSLKSVLDGGIEGRPDNVLLYATSNRRHLMAREMIDNERSTAINPGESVDEKVSLADRFGLWLGFYNIDQATYLEIVQNYARQAGIGIPSDILHAQALEWSITRGSRSGRVAWQFVQDLAGC